MLVRTAADVTSTINIVVKDSSLVAKAARSSGSQTPLPDTAKQRYEQTVQLWHALRDV